MNVKSTFSILQCALFKLKVNYNHLYNFYKDPTCYNRVFLVSKEKKRKLQKKVTENKTDI